MQTQWALSRSGIRFASRIAPWVRWRHGWTVAFLSLCTALVVCCVHGFEIGNVNNFRDQSIQLPIIYSYADSSLYDGDFLLEARHSYVTWFYPALGVASRYVALDALMLGLYALSVLLTVGAIYALAEVLFPQRGVGLIAVLLWMAYFPNPGGDFTHSPFVTHSTLAIALDLWAIVLVLRQRYTASALILGLTANINAMTSFFVGVAWLFALLSDRRRLVRNLVRGGVVMGLTALPILWWRFSLPLAETSSDQFLEVIRMRLWYAVFPFSIAAKLWIGFGGLLALWLYSWRFGKPRAHQQILSMSAGIASLCVLGTLFTEVIPLEFMVEMQSIRSAWLLNLFILLYLAHMISRLLGSGQARHTAFAFLVLGGFVIARWGVEWSPPHHPTPYPLAVDLDTPWSQAHALPVAILMVMLLAALLIVFWRLAPRATPSSVGASRRTAAWMGLAVIGLAVPGLLPSGVPADQRALARSWEETLVWIEAHTPKAARFLTPPTLDGFRVVARRAQIGDWKDGTVGIFYNGWAIEWYRRMLALGFDPDTFTFEAMTQARLCAATDRYPVDYVVVFAQDGLRGTPVFENDRFQVIPVEDLECATDGETPGDSGEPPAKQLGLVRRTP